MKERRASMTRNLSGQQIKKTQGNTLVEYSLIGVLIVVVSIAVFILFGQNFRDVLADIKTDMKSHNDQAALIEAQAQASVLMAKMANNPASASVNASNSSSMAQTTGANGNQVGLGSKGSTTTSSKPPTATQQLKSLLVELANKAHEVAELQSILANIAKYSNNDIAKFKTTYIYYNGQMLNAWQLSWALAHGGEIIEMEQKKNEVLASGASDDLKNQIIDLTNQVTAKANATSDTANNVLNGNSDPAAVDQVTDAAATHQDAAAICDASGHKDDGTNCVQ
jgi:hypothetical protein